MTPDAAHASVVEHLDRDVSKWEWARKLTARVEVLEWRSRQALRIVGALLGLATAVGVYARDTITAALERRGEDRVRAVVLAEDRAQMLRHDIELQLIRRELAGLHGRLTPWRSPP